MIYVALLRGINVGGKSIVSMAALKTCFEQLGYTDVKTYINSGNVIFASSITDVAKLTKQIESALEQHFDNNIRVLVKSHAQIKQLVEQIPASWVNNDATKCDVIFLWPDIDQPDIVEQLPTNPAIEDVHYYPGAAVYRIDRANATKSRVTRIVGTPIYKLMTIRNPNTIRKVLALMDAAA